MTKEILENSTLKLPIYTKTEGDVIEATIRSYGMTPRLNWNAVGSIQITFINDGTISIPYYLSQPFCRDFSRKWRQALEHDQILDIRNSTLLLTPNITAIDVPVKYSSDELWSKIIQEHLYDLSIPQFHSLKLVNENTGILDKRGQIDKSLSKMYQTTSNPILGFIQSEDKNTLTPISIKKIKPRDIRRLSKIKRALGIGKFIFINGPIRIIEP